ncbi:MAG TPA: BadF/BadG/BcrA/BcrD ATPase family protein, partial [Candidatus Eisenbacteria bacterium]|nr:BadF/BadG/BcrA/BcrD ATPase family protein [Candidatus Eisenbacteria bacterium]
MIAFKLDAALDVGSSTVKGALLDAAGLIHAHAHRPIRGDLRACVSSVLRDLQRAADGAHVELVALTGSSAGGVASRLGIAETNEILAASLGAQCLAPGAGAVLEVGGEHSKFIRLTPPDADGKRSPRDFTLNSACSAGTGGFLEQEAHRLRLSIEELSERARTAETKIRIAGRCAVFAKTDIVHKHQNGLPLDDIAYALCLAMAQSVAGELVGHRPYDRPIVFVGGVASNAGMGRALRQALELEAGELLVPAAHRFADALGAILARRARGRGEG